MNLYGQQLKDKIDALTQMDRYYDISIEILTEIKGGKQLCIWYPQMDIAKITCMPFIVYVYTRGYITATCMKAGQCIFRSDRTTNMPFETYAIGLMDNDAALIRAVSNANKHINRHDLELTMRNNNIYYKIIRLDTKKVKTIPSKKLDVLDAVRDAVSVVGQEWWSQIARYGRR